MTEFELPYPTTLSDVELEQVRLGLIASAGAYEVTVVDRPTDYMTALAAALVTFIEERIEARKGGRGGPFEHIEPEDFTDGADE